MKTLSDEELTALAGQYFAPEGLYQYTKALPFLGSLEHNPKTLIAGQWTELVVEYTVGASGLADGAWIKGTFKFYSDWALFQTTDPEKDNYVSAEYIAGPLHPGQTAATVQSLAVRFDQKGHERPFQKAILIDVVDGYLNPGDKIVVRMGDRRWGSRGTRVQTFVEDKFMMRWYIDPVGTSRFAPIKPDIAIPIKPGPIAKVKAISPRVVRPNVPFPIHIHTHDAWGNATANLAGLDARITVTDEGSSEAIFDKQLPLPSQGWTVTDTTVSLPTNGDYTVSVSVSDIPHGGTIITTTTDPITAESSIPTPRPLFADLHVHSDDTVGTNSSTYNFSYAQHIAGLDIVGYTANDFNITQARWTQTLAVIASANIPDKFLIYPGTEWCGNSAAGGDHNVVFLDDPTKTTDVSTAPAFPLDRAGNVARSFEWNEHGPAQLRPGAWPLDELYATYAAEENRHLLIPHVGGRRCNLAWHHPRLERLLEVGSAWGVFEWLLRDAVRRGWRMGVCANSDEHRGRCGGGVPGTAVFGARGGLTGVWGAERVEWRGVAAALRARRTFATTGERLVGLVEVGEEGKMQGDEVEVGVGEGVEMRYRFYGRSGFGSVEAWDAGGMVFRRDLQREAEQHAAGGTRRKLRVRWSGARVYDRYREAVWRGSILVTDAVISHIQPFGGVLDNPEDVVELASESQVIFNTRTSGDFDGVDIFFVAASETPSSVSVTGKLGGYVKVGNVLNGNPHKPQPEFRLSASRHELEQVDGKQIEIKGGAELAVSAGLLLDVPLPRRVEGTFSIPANTHAAGENQAVYFVGRESHGGKVITSPVFLEYIA
ncbi:polymerase histidinol phosphatase-like [Diplodia corticola]|uniref:Polymerase histidinol phosphatase-like n=1 Tax=Diplodia corticola TaxID=236234 RepID=A0A1J9RXP9_9PEZI|nr:polymerase histidinol phosphatase-like [Diplodia corticola]OJD32604.1 polymerase histidinol phosphatase-like [Diplodia corticola]